jgi:hypothetical protein
MTVVTVVTQAGRRSLARRRTLKWSRGSLSVGGLCNNVLRRTTEAQRFPAVRWQRSCNGQPDEQLECFNASGRARAVAGATVLAKSLACCHVCDLG